MFVTLTPAYGRDYKNKKEVLKDWNGNKDFIINCITHPYDGKPMNKEQAEKGEQYNIRYRNNTQICPVKA